MLLKPHMGTMKVAARCCCGPSAPSPAASTGCFDRLSIRLRRDDAARLIRPRPRAADADLWRAGPGGDGLDRDLDATPGADPDKLEPQVRHRGVPAPPGADSFPHRRGGPPRIRCHSRDAPGVAQASIAFVGFDGATFTNAPNAPASSSSTLQALRGARRATPAERCPPSRGDLFKKLGGACRKGFVFVVCLRPSAASARRRLQA